MWWFSVVASAVSIRRPSVFQTASMQGVDLGIRECGLSPLAFQPSLVSAFGWLVGVVWTECGQAIGPAPASAVS